MQLLRSLAPWLLLAFLVQQVSLSSGARNKPRGADKAAVKAPSSAEKALARGKFSLNSQMQCTWEAKDEEDWMALRVNCENPTARITGGVTHISCQYNGNSRNCPGYVSDPKGYWKQVRRTLKRLKDKVCTDDQVKVAMCKHAPSDAQLTMVFWGAGESAPSGDVDTRPTTAAKPSN